MVLETGDPDFSGFYAVQYWHGWRILEWARERWEHPGTAIPWPGKSADIEGWIGPLPKLPPPRLVKISPEPPAPVDEMGDLERAAHARIARTTEYDL